jgi:hypothetical protein
VPGWSLTGSLRYVPRVPKAAVPARPAPEPLDVDAFTVVAIGTALWFVAFCVLLVLRVTDGAAAGAAVREWLWTTLAGWLLGLLGLFVTRHHRHPHRRR